MPTQLILLSPIILSLLVGLAVGIGGGRAMGQPTPSTETKIAETSATPMTLWYDTAAPDWVGALPVGNGRLGGMVFGGLENERIALNEATLWSGSPVGRQAPEAADHLPAIRAAVAAREFAKAEQLVRKLQGPWTEAYMPLGDLFVELPGMAGASGYRRELDLRRAVQTTTYTLNDATYTRESFATAADGVIVMRLTCSKAGRITFKARLDSKLGFKTIRPDGRDTLVMTNKAPRTSLPSYTGGKQTYADDVKGEGMNAETRLRVTATGGQVTTSDTEISVDRADSVTLIVAAATSYNGPTRSPGMDGKDPSVAAKADLEKAAGRTYEQLLERHLADYRPRFERVSIDLGPGPTEALPTDQRVLRWKSNHDPVLAALLFQYGRYLLISSSRPGGIAANLQGIWNDKIVPPWSANYTTNINVQMNYWPAETTNLADSHQALIDQIRVSAHTGEQTAKRVYGASGWVIHHNSEPWGTSWPVGNGKDDPVWANWPMGGVWLADHLWQHYAFDPDEKYLRDTAYPLMKGAAQFGLAMLVDDGRGNLVTSPSSSPETKFRAPDVKGQFAITAGATMDQSLLRELFKHTADAADLLKVDADFAALLRSTRAKLLQPQVSPDGTLAEWADPSFKASDVHHRHVSHLIGFFPLADITADQPQLVDAVRKTLIERGDDSTGWSLAWKLNLWARLRDGDHCLKLMDYIFRPVGFGKSTASDKEIYHGAGGVYTNLFGAHPPFQIDGNFGFTSGVAEMLMQSHHGTIDLLPALPTGWPEGYVTGLRARGGFEVDQIWSGGKLKAVTVHSTGGESAMLNYNGRTAKVALTVGQSVKLGADLQPAATGAK